MKGSALVPIRSDKGNVATKKYALYKQIVHTEAWKDYQHLLGQMRENTRLAIERGVPDKYGKRHDDEQRLVLHVIDQMLTYWPAIQEYNSHVQAHLKAQEAMANEPLYGDDVLADLT